MKRVTIHAILSLMLVAFIAPAMAQFEGSIKFTKTVGINKTTYVYYIKGDMVRVEEMDDEGGVHGIQLANLKEDKVYGLSPERKVYIEVPKRKAPEAQSVEVSKTKNTKTVAGAKCTEVVVKSKDENRSITYWLSNNAYDFFTPFLKTINRKEKQSLYFLEIDGMDGSFPMMSEEVKDGKVVSKLVVTEVKAEAQDDSKFKIPADYEMFDRN